MTHCSDLITEWLTWLAEDQRRSPHTVKAYARTLRTIPDAATATLEDVEAWWDSRKHLSDATRNNELSALRSFYSWAQKWDHRADDPTRRLTAPRKAQRLSVHVGREDLRTLLDGLPDELRRATALGAYAGLRVSEAAVIHWHDIDRELGRVIVRGGKGGKDRMVGMSALLLDHLLPDRGGNVVTGRDVAWTGHYLSKRWKAEAERLGVEGHFHMLRHRFGTIATAAGVPLTSVQRAMGHASPATTAVYVGASDTDLDLIAEAVAK